MSFDVQAPVGSVAVAVSLSNVSRATVTPQQLLFTPNNWSVPQLVRAAAAVLHSYVPSIVPFMHVSFIHRLRTQLASGSDIVPALCRSLYKVMLWQSRINLAGLMCFIAAVNLFHFSFGT